MEMEKGREKQNEMENRATREKIPNVVASTQSTLPPKSEDAADCTRLHADSSGFFCGKR